MNRSVHCIRVSLLALLTGGFLLATLLLGNEAGQPDFRRFRSPNHIVMALRPLAPDEQWPGLTYTKNEKKYAIVSWGNSSAVSGSGYMLTNNHVIKNGELILVGGWKDTGKLVIAEVKEVDEKNDLALLKVDPPNTMAWITTFQTTKTLLEGEEIFLWGYLPVQGGFVQFLRRGIVSLNVPLGKGFEHFLYVEVSASFGTSGSPVFTHQGGDPIGLVSTAIALPGGIRLPSGVLGVIHGETVRAFLNEAGVPGY